MRNLRGGERLDGGDGVRLRWPLSSSGRFGRRSAGVVCVIATSLAVGVAGGGGATTVRPATATGRVAVTWTYVTVNSESVERETGQLVYEVSGPVMGEQGRRAYVRLSFPAGYAESKLVGALYLRARLVTATLTRTFHAPCADGGAADLTTSITQIVDPHSILTHDQTLQLDVLRHRGMTNLMPYYRVLRQG
ncbi:MAG: hypothetical protein M3P18_25410, partial [Actinomycetota bacterium]|nr:hypothetical protein [Actinomycetota bacterium]